MDKDAISSRFSLEGKVAIVTGGNGILGKGFVKTLASAGAKVVIFDIAKMDIEGSSKGYVVDITKRAEITAALDDIEKGFGKPSVLVNCAAIDVPPDYSGKKAEGMLESQRMEDSYDKVMEVNVKGTLLCSQMVGERMETGGSIINISSIYGHLSPDQRIYVKKGSDKAFLKPIAYCASKAAIPNITRYLATHFAGKGVRANTLTFGGVFNGQDPEFVANYSSKVPLGRMARKGEYDAAVLFLASDASSYMTGSDMVVDGGYMIW